MRSSNTVLPLVSFSAEQKLFELLLISLARWSTIAVLTFELNVSPFFLNIFIKKVSSLWLIYRFSPFMEIIFNWVDDNWHFSSRGFVREFSSWISAEQLICKESRNLWSVMLKDCPQRVNSIFKGSFICSKTYWKCFYKNKITIECQLFPYKSSYQKNGYWNAFISFQ